MDTNAPQSDASDGSLLRRFQGGEQNAATAIYLRYAQRLNLLAQAKTGRELLVRLDPEDIVQSVFRTFFRRAALGHYQVPDGDELWKLFLVIALNKIRTLGEFHRAAKRDVGHTTDLERVGPGIADSHGSDEDAYRILRMTVDELLAELPDTQRQMVVLRIEGHDVQAIAQATGRAKRSVERALQNFRERLSGVLTSDECGRISNEGMRPDVGRREPKRIASRGDEPE
ncbi:MAG: sigma-70 family RNA polymerase sigma factor [Pirellulaceae bacterium]|nr:sigma-70 family RNA polymerase sigma factor [Pirellulaceae bacterium]